MSEPEGIRAGGKLVAGFSLFLTLMGLSTGNLVTQGLTDADFYHNNLRCLWEHLSRNALMVALSDGATRQKQGSKYADRGGLQKEMGGYKSNIILFDILLAK